MINKILALLIGKVILIVGAVVSVVIIIFTVIKKWDTSLLKLPKTNILGKVAESFSQLEDMKPLATLPKVKKPKIEQLPNYQFTWKNWTLPARLPTNNLKYDTTKYRGVRRIDGSPIINIAKKAKKSIPKGWL